MGALVDNLALIQEEAHVAINGVHHIPADGTARLRGHGSLFGACDVTERVEKKGRLFTATIDDANDMTESGQIVFRLVDVELARCPVTGLVLSEAAVAVPAEAAKVEKDRAKLTPKEKLAFEALTSLVAKRGEKLPPHLELPAGLRAVSVTVFKE